MGRDADSSWNMGFGKLHGALLCAGLLLLAFLARRALLPGLEIVAGAAVIAFLLEPLSAFYERRLSPGLAALAALFTIAAFLAALLWLLIPALTRQLMDLAMSVPTAVQKLRDLLARMTEALQARGFSGFSAPELDSSMLSQRLLDLAHGTFSAASGLSGTLSRVSLMVVLGYFFLRDRQRLLLRLELLLPLRVRSTAVRAASSARRELRMYLCGQATVALVVGALSSLGLLLAGVHSSLVLGLLVGLFNMVPYFGPVLGAVPALVIALGKSPATALWAGLALFLVQQLDGAFISPKIMSGLTGFSPGTVLLAIYLGAQVAGIAGMLFALPVLITLRACIRAYGRQKEECG